LRSEVARVAMSQLQDNKAHRDVRFTSALLLTALHWKRPDAARLTFEVVLNQYEDSRTTIDFGLIMPMLERQCQALGEKDAAKFSCTVVSLAKGTTDTYQLGFLVTAFTKMAGKLRGDESEEYASVLANFVLSQAVLDGRPDHMQTLAMLLETLADKLQEKSDSKYANSVLSLAAKTDHSDTLLHLTNALGILVNKLNEEHAASLAITILRLQERPVLPSQRSALAKMFESMANKLSEEQATKVAEYTLTLATKRESSIDEFSFFAECLVKLANRLPMQRLAKYATSVAEVSLSAGGSDTDRLSSLTVLSVIHDAQAAI
jgi:hypothetical protein